MLRCCEKFALSRGLRFNAAKTQLIHFSYLPSSHCRAHIMFCNHLLPFVDTVTHLGHLLHFNLSDAPDISYKLRDMVKKANYVLVTFPCVGPQILTKLFQFYCLSLYGSSLWLLSSPALHSIALKLHLPIFFASSGVCPDIVILVLCTLWPTYIVYLMLCFYAHNV